MKVNGEKYTPDGKSIEEILKERGLTKEMVAVELNEKILPKSEYGSYVPKENDVIEIVQFMGGGC
ncbi:MAG: sulfur carrier protein ThiS [Lachnospiraceae bacterium]|nr:sulfur carrier protein ThiS [Lachnospiraceae bacterium]